LKPKCGEPLSSVALNLNVRRYSKGAVEDANSSAMGDLCADVGERHGLTLVHIFAQPEPFLSLKSAKHPTTWDKKCSH